MGRDRRPSGHGLPSVRQRQGRVAVQLLHRGLQRLRLRHLREGGPGSNTACHWQASALAVYYLRIMRP